MLPNGYQGTESLFSVLNTLRDKSKATKIAEVVLDGPQEIPKTWKY